MRSKKLEDYKRTLALTNEQREVLVGILLGDAHLESRTQGRVSRLKIEQAITHKHYVSHLYDIFKPWVITPPQRKEKRRPKGTNIWFQTVSHESLQLFTKSFYREGKKHVPERVQEWLTPRGLAYWYMDDGSMKSLDSKGVIFNTQSFSRNDVERLCAVLRDNFDLQCSPRSQRDGWQIFVSGRSYEKLSALVEAFLIPEMKYKFPTVRKTQLPKK
ncbi:MAG: hypothetical protein J5J00_17105 [Deltaproteobacteria bacterium]|nr:hypothetical protein [Deltaproteobacteria bacterium]